MKKKLFFLLTLLVCCIGQVSGETAELKSVSTKNVVGTKGESVALTFGGVTCTVTRNSGNQPGFYTSSGIVRYYGNDVMTLSVPEGNAITNIALTYTSGGTNHSVGVGTLSKDGTEWTGSANSVSFTGSNTVKISTIKVTYTAGSTPTKTLKSIAVSGTPTKTAYYVGDAFNTDGLVVTGTYDDASTDQITKDITWTVTPATLTAGTTSVSVVAKVGTIESSAYTVNGLTVTEKPVPVGYAGVYTSGEGLLTTTGGTSASTAKVVIDGTQYDAIKAGTGKEAGAIKVTVPAGTKTLHFHALGWNGEKVEITVNGQTYSLTSDTGVSSNSPFTLTSDPSEVGYYKLDTNNAATLSITFEATAGKRFVLFGVNAEAGELPSNPSIFADNLNIAADATSGEIAYTITNPVTGKTLSATTDASWITISQVTTDKVTFTTTANTGTAERTANITLKYEGATDKVVTVTQAKPVPTYASLADLVDAGEPTTDGEPVNVTLTNEEITKFYITGSYTNGVFLQVGTQEIEIYCKNVPETWEVGGTISGTLTNCLWKNYNGTWELCPDNWDDLGYTAPAPGTLYTITWSVNGTTTTEDVEEGAPIEFKPATVPAGFTDYAFRGWVASETVSGTTEPTYVTTATATADITYYAVFAKKTTTGGAASLAKLDGTSTLAGGDKLAIFAHVGDNYYGMKHETISSSYVNYYVLEVAPTYEAVTADALNWWTLNAAEKGKWTLGDASNGYLVNASSNDLIAHGTNTGSSLTIAWDDTNSAFTIKNGDRWIGCRSDLTGDNQYKFRGAGNGTSPTPKSSCYLDIYRITTGTVTYSDWTTTLVAPEAYTLNVSKYGYSTLYLDKAVEIPEGVTVYYCTTKDDQSLNAVKIESGYVPAYTGVVVEAKEGTYNFEYTDQQLEKLGILTGVLEETPVQEIRGKHNNAPVYVLSVVEGTVGFYNYADTATLQANRAFLEGAEDAPPVNGFILDFDMETVGVSSVVNATNLKDGYDLQGRRVNKATRGLLIQDGKKVLR